MKETIRLQVFLSHAGICSRRQALELVKSGKVSVNGKKVLEPSTPVDSHIDQISVGGKIVSTKQYQYIMLNKPTGVITTKKDRFAERTVMDILPVSLQHLHPVGRLDKDTEGLLLLTNDGALTHKMTHPKFEIEKTYLLLVKERLTPADVQNLEKGILINNIKTASARVQKVVFIEDTTQFLLSIHEGRKRQIRQMMNKLQHPVIKLKRIAQGPLKLGDLNSGEFRELNKAEIDKLGSGPN